MIWRTARGAWRWPEHPRFLQSRPEHGISKRSYIDAVLAGIQAFNASADSPTPPAGADVRDASGHASGAHAAAPPHPGLTVRLLLSIDRREGSAAAQETVRRPAAALRLGRPRRWYSRMHAPSTAGARARMCNGRSSCT